MFFLLLTPQIYAGSGSSVESDGFDTIIDGVTSIIGDQWPRYRHDKDNLTDRLSRSFSIVAVDGTDVIGHVSVSIPRTESADQSGCLATVYFVIVPTHRRGAGVGRLLMAQAEAFCRGCLGDFTIVAWPVWPHRDVRPLTRLLNVPLVCGIRLETIDKMDFYAKLGYRRQKSIQLVSERPCFGVAKLRQEQLNLLSRHIAGFSRQHPSPASSEATTEMVKYIADEEYTMAGAGSFPPEWSNAPDMFVSFEHVSWMVRSRGDDSELHTEEGVLAGRNSPLPWCRQVGPSCGLATIKMILGPHHNKAKEKKTLLHIYKDVVADETRSALGELLSVDEFVSVASSYISQFRKVTVKVCAIDALHAYVGTPEEIIAVAYDRGPDELPSLATGSRAHWGVITCIFRGAGRNAACLIQHGASKVRPLCTLSRLCDSNSNLERIFTVNQLDGVVGETSLKGLRSQFVIFHFTDTGSAGNAM